MRHGKACLVAMNKEWREEILERYDRDAAILKILKVLKNPMMVMCKPNRDEALTLAEEYGIMAKDLIEQWAKIAERV